MELFQVIVILLVVFLPSVALLALVIGLIWFFFVGRRIYREKKSLSASRGDEMAMAMEKNHLKARVIGIVGFILWPVVLVTAMAMGASFIIALGAASMCSALCGTWSAKIWNRAVMARLFTRRRSVFFVCWNLSIGFQPRCASVRCCVLVFVSAVE